MEGCCVASQLFCLIGLLRQALTQAISKRGFTTITSWKTQPSQQDPYVVQGMKAQPIIQSSLQLRMGPCP